MEFELIQEKFAKITFHICNGEHGLPYS